MGRGVRSGRVAVLVDKSTQDVDAVDPPNLGQAGRCRLTVGGGYAKVNAPMGAGGVVVLHVDGEHLLQVAPVPDQQPVQALGSGPCAPSAPRRRSPLAPGAGSAHRSRGSSRANIANTSRSCRRLRATGRPAVGDASPVQQRHAHCHRSLPRGDGTVAALGRSQSDRGPLGGSGQAPAITTNVAFRLVAARSHVVRTRPGSRPALLPRVCGVTWEYVTPIGALDERRNLTKGIRTCALLPPEHARDRGSLHSRHTCGHRTHPANSEMSALASRPACPRWRVGGVAVGLLRTFPEIPISPDVVSLVVLASWFRRFRLRPDLTPPRSCRRDHCQAPQIRYGSASRR
jgi:hypothetical protein